MSLAQLLAPPPTPKGLEEFWLSHAEHHRAIAQATLTLKNVRLQIYNIYPFDPNNLQDFLLQHQQMHSDMESLYHVVGNDLSSVDFTDQRQRDTWFFLNFVSHRSVGQACGISI